MKWRVRMERTADSLALLKRSLRPKLLRNSTIRGRSGSQCLQGGQPFELKQNDSNRDRS
jgi:hypothetical protein